MDVASEHYYQRLRPEILAAVPISARHILDVGCAAGVLGAALRQRQPCRVTGIEQQPAIAALAARRLDEVIVDDAMTALAKLPTDAFDTIVLADVLEHVADTDGLLAAARRVLAAGGHLIVSVPNVRHWSLLRNLLNGDWTYRDCGILDRGHLRFFTRRSLQRHLTAHDLIVVSVSGTRFGGTNPMPWLASVLPKADDDIDLLADVDDYQLIFVCRKRHDGAAPR